MMTYLLNVEGYDYSSIRLINLVTIMETIILGRPAYRIY